MLAGEPPQLSEIGPYVVRRTTAHYNIRFDHEARRVDWQKLPFDELVPELSCPACTSDALVSACRASRSHDCLDACRSTDLQRQLVVCGHDAGVWLV